MYAQRNIADRAHADIQPMKEVSALTGYATGLNNRQVEDDPQGDARMARTDVDGIASGLSRRLGLPQDRLAKILQSLGRKAPPDTFQDAIQAIATVWLDEQPDKLEFCYGIGKNVIHQLWRAYHRHSHLSLDAESGVDLKLESELTQEQRTIRIEAQLREALVDTTEWTLIDSVGEGLDAQLAWANIPGNIREVIQTRLDGIRLADSARESLNRWVKQHGITIRHILETA